MIDYTITAGNLIEIAVIAFGGLTVLIKQTSVINNLKDTIREMQKEISKIGEILINNAVTSNRILNIEEDIRDMKKGRGWITEEVSGEYTRHGKLHPIHDISKK